MSVYYYSNCTTLGVGCYLYSDSACTTPVSNGYYSNGTTCWQVTGGSGYISSENACSSCLCYSIINETGSSINYYYTACGGIYDVYSLGGGQTAYVCSEDYPGVDAGGTVTACSSTTTCTGDVDCLFCS